MTGPPEVFGSSSGYFTLDPDGLSYDGQDIFNVTSDPVTSVILSGSFATTALTLNDGSHLTVGPNFTATITGTAGQLADGDFAFITATTGTTPRTPEPATWWLVLAGFVLLAALRLRYARRRHPPGVAKILSTLLALATASFGSSTSTVHLNTWTAPTAGVSGSTFVWVTGSGFPAGTITPSGVTLTLETGCGVTAGSTVATATAVKFISGTSDKVEFEVPASLSTATYYVTLKGSTTGGAAFQSGNCSAIDVTHTSPVLAACNPGSSMGLVVPAPNSTHTTPITAYVPNGSWSIGTTGVRVVPVEGSGSPVTIPTTGKINSCSSNSVTGETVCVDNSTGIYLMTGTTLTHTLTSGSTAFSGFSGGDCMNCGVAVNAAAGAKGQAVITMGYRGSPSALQFLDLASQTLGPPIPTLHEVSEDVLWDPFRNLILSPDEQSVYDLFHVTGSGTPGVSNVTEYARTISVANQELDSAGEDCTTGIALTTEEGAAYLYITDLTQATFSSGSWMAPAQNLNFPEFNGLFASAIAVAPGSTHLGVVAGEFGGNGIGVILLPSTSGSGTPTVVDYAAAHLPGTPDGFEFANGDDPHTTTAYTSPNNGQAYAVLASWVTGEPRYLGIVDLQALLNAPRLSGSHTVDPTYDLLAHGVVRYVATF